MNIGAGNRMRGMRGTSGMFTRIPGNLLQDSGEFYHFNIPGNVEENFEECSRTFQGILAKIPGVQEDSGECSKIFRGMFKKILGIKNTVHRVGTINLKL